MDSQNPYVLILAGQPPIRNKLSLNVNNPLRQRITVRYFLRGLNHEEVKPYCETRLKLAGVNEEIFTAPALEAMYSVTNGLPRLVNNLATACLLYACGHKKRLVDEETVYQAQEEIDL
jgi:type II secretory pathway predicted ATPase ExeA